MVGPEVPQPHPSRLTEFAGHPGVVGVSPGQPELVALTAASWARATGGALYFAYSDPSRYVVAENPDGTVRHAEVDPDTADDSWLERQQQMEGFLHTVVDPSGVPWEFRYLAGRPDRALTHLARAVNAAVIIVGTRAPGVRASVREFVDGSVAVQLAHHQHRPVLTVPLSVVDWKAPLA
ncbi:MAG TPA: universal stress protein [Cellulomonas sp.]|nr:universal stress protein [Cellulomonas sp.]